MTRLKSRPPAEGALPDQGLRCYYWVCASIMMDAGDGSDPRAMARVHGALTCAQSKGCVRANDCQEVALGALGRLLQQRPRD
ncbi:MAG TPA: hypothetical protein VK196_03875 [Magnetospirillum sp.]|nr:hypothetical protein [Magnetospirillum sp.]